MRHGSLLGALALVGVCAASAQAGVYSTVEAKIEPPFSLSEEFFRKFQNTSLIPLRRVGTTEADQPWQQLYALTAASVDLSKLRLPPDKKDDSLTVVDRLNIGVCLLRMRKFAEAVEVLKIANRQAPDNFIVISTLGTAYSFLGEWQSAGDWLSESRRHWDKPYENLKENQKRFLFETMGWNEGPFSWYGKCEKYQRRVVLLRHKELKKVPLGFGKSFDRLDTLFPLDAKPNEAVRYVAESGKFEPGKIAAAEKAKLPKDAISIVQQLLIWMPEDLRLYWQLGELCNANGDIDSAKMIFMEFLNKYAAKEEFKAFGKVDPLIMLPKFTEAYPEVGNRLKALLDYVPPPPVLPTDPPAPKTSTTTPGKKPADDLDVGELKLDWQALGVGFGVGLVSGILFVWQIREIRRRRQARQAARWQPAENHG